MSNIVAFDDNSGLPSYRRHPSLQTGVTGNVADFGSGAVPTACTPIKGKVWTDGAATQRTLDHETGCP